MAKKLSKNQRKRARQKRKLIKQGKLPEPKKSKAQEKRQKRKVEKRERKAYEKEKVVRNTTFNFDKPYIFNDGYRMMVAFRGYKGDVSFEEILTLQRKKSNSDLMKELKRLVEMPETYTGKNTTSSGKAGDCLLNIDRQNIISIKYYEDVQKVNKRKKTKNHEGDYAGFQVLKSHGRISFDTVTMRKLLEVSTAIMKNVTEQNRTEYYRELYRGLKHIPELRKKLPPPIW